MPALSDFQIGQTILHQDRAATVAFVGSTHFAPGDWVGVIHSDPIGKNNGEVQGRKYFECEANHGMFVRPAAVTAILDDGETPRPAEKNMTSSNRKSTVGINGKALKGNRQSIIGGLGRRSSVVDPTSKERGSINAGSPTPGARGPLVSRLASPTKSPTKASTSRPSSISSTSGATRSSMPFVPPRPSSVAKAPRASMLPPSSRPTGASRPSFTNSVSRSLKPGSNSPSDTSRSASDRVQLRSAALHRMSSIGARSHASLGSRQASPPSQSEAEPLSPSIGEEDDEPPLNEESRSSPPEQSAPSSAIDHVNGTATRGRSPRIAPPQKPSSQGAREIENLQTKIRVLEKKRMEDREKLKDLDRIQQERDRFEAVVQKLQTKYQPQQEELLNLKKQLQAERERADNAQEHSAEHDSTVEMATLDREMAEETAEALRSELDALRQRHEEVELELEILREENSELGKEISPEERASQGWAQMERSNERLRDALMRLRDVSQQQESDLKDQVAELEKDLQDLGAVKEERDATKERLLKSEAALEDLRQQLDTALGAEEMIEELTDRNDTLNQKLANAKSAIEELESLKELNDELELNHIETEKQMQDDIDYNESLLDERKRKVATQDSTIQDLEYTVSRFRELVATMQSDLEEVRASRQLSEKEATELNSKSKDMMDLNLRLQASAAKAQVRAIDLELNKMDAEQSAEHLEIVQHLLPDTFKTERNCILAFLRCKRIAFKANLLHGLIKDQAEAAGKGVDPFACYDVLNKLTILSASSKSLTEFMQSCGLESFLKLESTFYDLEPVEKSLTGWMEDVKREAFKEVPCGQDLRRLNSLLSHLIEVHVKESFSSQASKTRSCGAVLHSYIEMSALSVGQLKSLTRSKFPMSEEDLDSTSEEVYAAQNFARQADELMSSLHSLKVVVQKSIRNLNDLHSRSLIIDPASAASSTIEEASATAEAIFSAAQNMGSSLLRLFSEEDRTAGFTYDEITLTISNEDKPFAPLTNLVPALMITLQNVHVQTSSLSHTIELPPPPPAPWFLLAQNLKEQSSRAKDNERTLAHIQQEMSQKNTILALREKDKEEMSVQIEVLTQRVNESGGRREQVRELEDVVKKVEKENKIFKKELEKREHALSRLEAEKETWVKTVERPSSPSKRGLAATDAYGEGANLPPSSTTTQKLSMLESELEAQRSAIRHLRSQISTRNRTQDIAFLSTPLVPSTSSSLSPLQTSQIQEESRACLSTLLSLATSRAAQPIVVSVRPKDERLKWRPKQQSSEWKLSVLREEYEGWNAWMKDLTRDAERQSNKKRAAVKVGNGGGRWKDGADRDALRKDMGGTEIKVVSAEEDVGA